MQMERRAGLHRRATGWCRPGERRVDGLLSGLESFSVDNHGLGANGAPPGMSVGALLGWEIVLTVVIFSATKEGADGSVTGRRLAVSCFWRI